ncbi:hypothetical protein V6N11_077342 [Hibiscus sabdariffa]|uniref:RNase H type-1 domain-containing protein n=1 Tax=Hibiscus sabdariffa TaxID=183260 RepID=A0ABR2TDJ2_9ROSI
MRALQSLTKKQGVKLCMVRSVHRDHGTRGLVLHIKELCNRNWMITFNHVCRKGNFVADRMTRLVVMDDLDVWTFDDPSSLVIGLVLLEMGVPSKFVHRLVRMVFIFGS